MYFLNTNAKLRIIFVFVNFYAYKLFNNDFLDVFVKYLSKNF